MRKALLVALSSLFLLLWVFVSGSVAKTTINLLGPIVPPYRLEEFKKIVEIFERENPDIKVVVEQASSWPDTETKALVRFGGGGGPDMLQSGETGAVTEFASAGMFEDLGPYLDKDPTLSTDDFFAAPMKLGQWKGKTYALPQDAINTVLYYNKDLLAQAGFSEPPDTMEDLRRYAIKITDVEKKQWGKFVGPGFNEFSDYLFANGGSFMNEDNTKITFNDSVGVETLQYIVDNILKHKASAPVGTDTSDLWIKGKLAMIIGVPWYVGYTRSYGPNVNYGATVHPRGKVGRTGWGWAHYISVLSNSKHKDEAYGFISFLLRDDIDLTYHDKLNFLPGKIATWEKPPFNEHFAWRAFRKQLADSKPFPIIKGFREMQQILGVELEAAYLGKKAPREALNDAARKATEKLGL